MKTVFGHLNHFFRVQNYFEIGEVKKKIEINEDDSTHIIREGASLITNDK